MDAFNQYATLIVLVAVVLGLPSTINCWRAASRYYGRVRLQLARNLWTYALRSAYRFHLLGVIGLHGLTAMGELRWLLKGEPYPRWLCLTVLFWSWRFVADRVCPPVALFISSSDRRVVEAKGWLAFRFRRHRLLSFLALREHVNPVAFQAFFGDDLRVRSGAGWRTPVYHLTDVTPVVVADVRYSSPAVEEEVGRLVENGLASKVRFVTNGTPPAWLTSLFGAVHSEPSCIEDGYIEKILNGPDLAAHDLEHRQSLQDEYTSLFREIPLAARPDLPLREAQVTALAILDREYRRFLRAYKGMELPELGSRLAEEIPSVVSREEEDAYLCANRALQIADAICRGIREELKEQHGAWATFHGASLDTKLGKLNRFRRRWKPALNHLRRAQRVLREMRNDEAGEVDLRIVASELGDALFLEGEVWAVQFLDAPSEEKRSKGLICFREVLEVDQSLGREDPAVLLRIQLLGGSNPGANGSGR